MCGELGITLREIVISGGGSTSPLFMQIFADVFGIPCLARQRPERCQPRLGDLRRGRDRRLPGLRDGRGAHGEAARSHSRRILRTPTFTAA